MFDHLAVLLEAAVARPELRLSALPLLTEAERQQVLVEWNDTAADFPADPLSTPSSKPRPGAPRTRSPSSSARTPSPTASSTSAPTNSPTTCSPSVSAPRCASPCASSARLDMAVGLLGVLKAGAAYVPLDPSYPSERLAFMLRDSLSPLLLTQSHLADELPVQNELLVLLDSEWDSLISLQPTHAPVVPSLPDSLAYVIYTSGSTGRPKGAMLSHRGVVNYLLWCTQAYAVSDGDGAPVHSSLSFDLTVTSLLAPLVVGRRVVLVPESQGVEGLAQSLLAGDTFSLVKLTPSHLRLLEQQLPADKVAGLTHSFVIGGEALTPDMLSFWREHAPLTRLVNEYGPTETVVGCCVHTVLPGEALSGSVSIGRPIANTRLYILDSHLLPVPSGVPGELFIGGAQVGRGYLGRPDLSAERFLPDPFSSEPGARLYRTGDKARWMADGRIDYLGRLDFQVKVRGFRIELGEIEAALEQHPQVHQAVVLVREDLPGDKRLVAYVSSHEEQSPQTSTLRDFVQQRLPEYMVPSAFVLLDSLPLTSNGKVDRGALPAPDALRSEADRYVAPRTPTEQLLASQWSQLLGVSRVSAHDNFFELGGHSLLATQVISRVRATFGIDLPIGQLFDSPSLEAFAVRVDTHSREGQGLKLPPLQPVTRTGALPLSFAQQRLWFLDQLVPESPLYNVPAPLRLEGTLDMAVLERGLTELVRRHEVLRTTFPSDSGQPLQVITPPARFPLEHIDLSALPADQKESEARRRVEEECRRPFSLARGPLLRATLLKLDEREHVLLFNMHHIISDGWSLSVLVREVAALYEAFSQGQPSPLPELSVQYADYAAWQRAWLQGETLEAQFTYWREQLAHAPKVLELPTDKPRPAVQSYRGASLSRLMPRALSQALQTLCQREGVTSFMALLATFQVLLSRYSGQTDIVVGTDIAGRTHADTESLIGFFVNQLVMRGDLSGDPSFRELLGRTRQVALGAYAHQDVPFEELVRVLNPERSLAHSPLFQVKLVLQNTPVSALNLPGLALRGVEGDTGAAKLDLTLTFHDLEQGLSCLCDYSTDLFEAGTVGRMLEHLQVLLEAAVAHPDSRLSSLPLLTEVERQQVLVEWNDTLAPLASDTCIHHLFEAQVRRTPDAPALGLDDGSWLSYRQLDEHSNRLAHLLRSLGVGPELRVALCSERSLELVVGLLAILKSGGAYVPLDPSYPLQRLEWMLEDSRPSVLLSQPSLLPRLPQPRGFRWCPST